MNNSWGWSGGSNSGNLSNMTSINYQGTSTDLTGNTTAEKKAILEAKRVPVPGNTYLFYRPVRNAATDADVQDAIDDGVIVVASAGNSYWPIDVSGGPDYNNTVTISGSTYDVAKGSSPGSADNIICVGSLGTNTGDYKSYFSNFSERVDVWAPGTNIMSAVKNQWSGYDNQQQDSRDSSYYIGSNSGTSMSGPQITGLLACVAEQWPNMTQSEALQFLTESSKAQVGTQGTVVTSPYEALGDSNNRYVSYFYKRPQSGTLFPHDNHGNRVSSTNGVKYPRVTSVVTKTS